MRIPESDMGNPGSEVNLIMPGIALNEDSSHFFISRAARRLDAEQVAAWVDQYADTQVQELILNPNAMRTSYASEVWDPIWRGYDPQRGDDQPLFASLSGEARQSAFNWVHTAWQLNRDGIDVYAQWIARCRQRGISPWISMRMNDVHNAEDENNFIHSEFWRARPDLRRVSYRFHEWTDRAFDYGQAEVREYHLALIRELAERYDFDGMELDWMRFGFHFRPGHESAGIPLLNQFMAEVRGLLDDWGRKRGHKILLGARVPSRPETSLALGMEAVTWARQSLVDMLVVTPFWATTETDMPIETWKALLHGTQVVLAAGLEILVRPHPAYWEKSPINSLETVRGAATTMLDRGADRIYLFNYMDDPSSQVAGKDYPKLLREVGDLQTLSGKPRRHVLTYADTWAPGEPRAIALPARCGPGASAAFRLPTGPQPEPGEVTAILGIEGEAVAGDEGMEVRVNGEVCRAVGRVELPEPRMEVPTYGFVVPPAAMKRGHNLIEVTPRREVTFCWVEFYVRP
ncbi:MAG TPA: hypothetical protein VM221_13785 [Armatimonadota bacterium]|nr:hypothetical protein [Armatimonadota bacterium]